MLRVTISIPDKTLLIAFILILWSLLKAILVTELPLTTKQMYFAEELYLRNTSVLLQIAQIGCFSVLSCFYCQGQPILKRKIPSNNKPLRKQSPSKISPAVARLLYRTVTTCALLFWRLAHCQFAVAGR